MIHCGINLSNSVMPDGRRMHHRGIVAAERVEVVVVGGDVEEEEAGIAVVVADVDAGDNPLE